jgi:hypothetical protein
MSRCLRAAVVGAILFVGSGTVLAQSGPRLRIGHYSTGSGLIGFVLDRMGMPIKLRFDGSDEIFALAAERSPYDSTTLKRDDGAAILRIYESGRVVVFGAGLPNGSADARRDQDAEPLTVKAATKEQAKADADELARKLRAAGPPALAISLDAPHLADDSAAWSAMADAVAVVRIALTEMLASAIARDTITAKLQRIVIRDAGQINVKLSDGTLIVEIAAKEPIVGRPSSARLKSAIGDLL